MGILSGALSGLGEGLMTAGKYYADYLTKSTLKSEEEAAQKLRDERLADIQAERDQRNIKAHEEVTIRAEERKLAVGKTATAEAEQEIAFRTGWLNDIPITSDDEGNPLPRAALPEREQLAIRAAAFERAGDSDQAHRLRQDIRDIDRTEAGNRRTDVLERKTDLQHQEVLKRLDMQFEHQKKQDSVAGANAQRMLMVAEEQVKGVRLDNEQKQRLANLDKAWDATTDPKEREKLAERRMMLTGKWNEAFEIKTEKDALGNTVILGFWDKHRGTFADTKGVVTDMRTGRKISSGGNVTAPPAAIAALRADETLAPQFDQKYGSGSAETVLRGRGELDPARFTTKVPLPTKRNPITGEPLTRSQFERKFGKGTFDLAD